MRQNDNSVCPICGLLSRANVFEFGQELLAQLRRCLEYCAAKRLGQRPAAHELIGNVEGDIIILA